MIKKLKHLTLVALLFGESLFAAANNFAATIHLSPQVATVEQMIGSSLVITNTGGSSVYASFIREVKPQVWVTNTGSSVTSFAFGGPYIGGSLAGQTNLFGGSLTLPMSWRFHAPSIYPAFGSSVQIGTQTYTVGAQITMSDGSIVYPTTSTIKVSPLSLPSTQQTGWHN